MIITNAVEYTRSLIQQGEGTHIEFKTSFQKEVIASLVAFANTKGGILFIGVNDTSKIIGVEIQAETLQAWVNQCKQNTTPSLIPDIEVTQAGTTTPTLFDASNAVINTLHGSILGANNALDAKILNEPCYQR